MGSSSGLKARCRMDKPKRMVECPIPWAASEVLQNYSHFGLVCEGERAAGTSPNDVLGLTNEEIRK